MELTDLQQIGLLERMMTLRRFEEHVAYAFPKGLIPGYVHLYIGEEAVAVGACAALREDDYITSTHRGHGHCLAKGVDAKGVMAELYAKRTGCCKGKGGSMHVADFAKNIIGAIGIVGGGFPIATGCGLSAKMRGTEQVTACFFGDGASNQGTFHESLNMSSIWKLPVLFICENNLFAISMRQADHQAIKNIAARASGYGMPGVTVDGNDVLAVRKAVADAAARARTGEGPSLIECMTYRWHGHGEFDDHLHQRTEEELCAWKEECPITRFSKKLIERGVLTEDDVSELDRKVAAQIEEAVAFAEASPEPAPEEALEDVYT